MIFLKREQCVREKRMMNASFDSISWRSELTLLGWLAQRLPVDMKHTRLIFLGWRCGMMLDAVRLAVQLAAQLAVQQALSCCAAGSAADCAASSLSGCAAGLAAGCIAGWLALTWTQQRSCSPRFCLLSPRAEIPRPS